MRVRMVSAAKNAFLHPSQTAWAVDAPDPVNQKLLTLVSSWSRSTASPGFLAGSVHSWNFSTIQASRPTGESLSA
jgi:hypothetical protein